MTLFALSGFLGCSTDWEGIPAVLEPETISKNSFKEWAKQYNDFARSFPAPRVLMAYSLGGRKALHALIADETLWSSAILISTHPGLSSSKERNERLSRDKIWSQRFLDEDWNVLLSGWNNQEVLKNSPPLFREEKQFSRAALACELEAFSLGVQRDLREEIKCLGIPLYWVAGGKDPKFAHIACEMAGFHNMSSEWILKEFGHRINFQLIYDALQYKLPREVKNGHLEKDQRVSRHQV